MSSGINPSFSGRRIKYASAKALTDGIIAGDRIALGRAITLIESVRAEDKVTAQEIIAGCQPLSGNSIRIGVTGAPGVGKSTFIERLGLYLIEKGHRPAVLAIDPSSRISGGSILGDKTRMAALSHQPTAFVRPSPAGSTLGGVARTTREAILLCEAAGFDTVLIETVGIGQSETMVAEMTDVFLLLLLPGAGDELQGIKRGVVEMADIIVVNKADGNRVAMAEQSRRAYKSALHLFAPKENQHSTELITCSALEGAGIKNVWHTIQSFISHIKENGYFEKRRNSQALHWFYNAIDAGLKAGFESHPAIKMALPQSIEAIEKGEVSPVVAAEKLLQLFLTKF